MKVKSTFYKILFRLFPRLKFYLDIFFFEKIRLTEIILSNWHFFFKNQSSWIAINGYTNYRNFGDALNYPLLKKITSKKVIHYNALNKTTENLLMIGSTMHLCDKDTIVWGAGCISETKLPKIKPKAVHAVRGPQTREVLLKNGIECPEVYGDPALLLPLIYKAKKIKKKYKLGLILHYVDKDNEIVQQLKNNNELKLINIRTGYNYKRFINQINNCEYIISSSLHGLIVADAYAIPNVWIQLSDKLIGGKFKFHDYFKSVKRNIEEPIVIKSSKDINNVFPVLSRWKEITFNHDVLISAFPFDMCLKDYN